MTDWGRALRGGAKEGGDVIWDTPVAMPRYHVPITGRDLRPVKKAVHIGVTGRKRSERTADLHAKSGKAAEALVKARLPKGSGAVVGKARKVKD